MNGNVSLARPAKKRLAFSLFSIALLSAMAILILILSLAANPETSVPLALSPPFVKEITFHNFSPLVILFILANYFIINGFGYSISRPLLQSVPNESIILRFVSTFFIGYLASIGIIRILSFFLPYKQIYWPTLLTIVLLTIVASLDWLQKKPWQGFMAKSAGVSWKSIQIVLKLLLLIGILYTLILLSQVTLGWFRFVSHGPYVPEFINYWWTTNLHTFPLIAQHYDLEIFNYFLATPWNASIQMILFFWMTLGFLKISIWIFIYLILQSMRQGRLFSFAASLFLMIGTSSLLPYKYYVLYDAINPLFFVINSRVASISFIFVLFAYMTHFHLANHHPSRLFFLLTGLGLSATTISNPLWLMIVFTFGTLMTNHYYKLQVMTRKNPAYGLEKVIIITALMAMPILFWLPFTGWLATWGRVIVIGFLLGLTVAWALWYSLNGLGYFGKWPGGRPVMTQLAVFNVAVIFGLIFLGNLFIDNPLARSVHNHISTHFETQAFFPTMQNKQESQDPFSSRLLSSFYPNDKVQFTDFMEIKEQKLSLAQKVEKLIGDHRIIEPELNKMANGLPAFLVHQAEYERGVSYFFAYYGGLILLFSCAARLFYARIQYKSWLRQDQIMFSLFVLFLAAIPLMLFFISFVDTSNIVLNPSNKSRFLEIPVYGAIFCSIYFISRLGSLSIKRYTMAWLIVYSVIPFIANDRLQQIAVNMKYLYWTIVATY